MGNEQTSTFDLTHIQQSLGVRSRIVNPQVSEGIGLVLTVGDMSKSFSSQKFEARGIASGASQNDPAQSGFLELHSVSAGGLVIEGIDVELDAAAGTNCIYTTGPTGLVVATAGSFRLQSVGGLPLSTTVVSGTVVGVPPVAPAGALFLVDLATGARTTPNDLEWFVPSGTFARLQINSLGLAGRIVMRFREIPQSPGPQ